MFAKVYSACLTGITASLIQVEIDISPGLPQFHIVGLPDLAVKESIKRVRAAIKNSGFHFPMQRITVNLAPADIRKEGASFDLAIATGILLASYQIKSSFYLPELALIVGELSLDGHIQKIPGILPIAEQAALMAEGNLILPHHNIQEAVMQPRITLFPLSHLKDFRNKLIPLTIHEMNNIRKRFTGMKIPEVTENFSDVERQYQAKRAALISAAGFHHLLLIGPPGSGKTMILRRIHSLLPPLNKQELFDVSKIYSIMKGLGYRPVDHGPPIRSPHHSITTAGLIGGGSIPRPGEISLSHKGLLILDELAEFSIRALEALRQPLEEGKITIDRMRSSVMFPAQFLLASAMNPCRCGYAPVITAEKKCQCTERQIHAYLNKVSGPLSDRIDLQIEMSPLIDSTSEPISNDSMQNWSTELMREKVREARERQAYRSNQHDNHIPLLNGLLSYGQLRKVVSLEAEDEILLKTAMKHNGLSARARDRILRIARTIADLDGADQITTPHLAEALQYRFLDKSRAHFRN